MKLTRISRWRSSSSPLWQLADESFFDEIFLTGEVKIESPVSETRVLFIPKPFLYWANSNSNPNPLSSTPRRCFKFDFWATILFFPNAIFYFTVSASENKNKNQIFFEFKRLQKQENWINQETNLYTVRFLDICSKCLQVCLMNEEAEKN